MNQCPEDLVHQMLHGKTTEEQHRLYLAHLDSCDDCRLELALARDFDAVLVTQPGDDEIAARVGARVVRAPQPRNRRFVGVAVAILLGSAGAAAGTSASLRKALENRFFGKHTEQPHLVAPASPPASGTVPPPDVGKVDPVVVPVEKEAEKAPEPTTAPPRQKLPEKAALENSATDLFAAANSHRRAGRAAEAQKLYSTLLQRYPMSQEALVSHVSLGRLLKGSAPAQALRHFNAYLGQSGHTTLAAEALYGKASVLASLGDQAKEKTAWRELLQRFPSSVYAEQARAQLEN
jgi:TolA-binding protein